jgi:hypothetical protein
MPRFFSRAPATLTKSKAAAISCVCPRMKEHAISYAEQRGRLGSATVRIYDEKGALEREIALPVGEDMLYAPHIRIAC